ncbi:TMEM165/GDT1 family protein [Methylococcus sp. Mc7]|uniref:TMEM165/GDT1 family protein n=1 Tax=Methylococcus sp. Mc7 TaxID=2860258 RepID=UPI001C53386D|nr:TMEM165/GDT1 family protein [Methylococcus sp. Mc7]QXP84816.1 TMEM165/GDT1 family protein [Methylococcus sp. Mc7]
MSCFWSWSLPEWAGSPSLPSGALEWATASATTFALIAAAEIGDKSQLVCMTLAARHRGLPVLLGATAAFGLLNLAAVLFGAALVHWVPRPIVAGVVALLFLGFGLKSVLAREEAEDESVEEKPGHGVFVTTFLMIVFAEFGDKTQLAVAGLGTSVSPSAVWAGASLALVLTSALGIWAGRTVLQKIPLLWLHRLSGVLFLALAVYAGMEAMSAAPEAVRAFR